MIKPIMRDPLFLAQKSEDATEADKQVVQDLLDTIFRMQIIDIKNSLFFESEEAEAEYLKSESLEDYDEEELDYTNRLSNLATLDLKSVEEKIEDEQRNNENGK